jgi:glycerol-3-phosphate dehydrogenase (NAD(P)+)
VAGGERIAVLGAGAMGTALALHLSAIGVDPVLLATDRDLPVLAAARRGDRHPTLHVPFAHLPCLPPEDWPATLAGAAMVFVAVSSGGLERVLAQAAPLADPEVWLLATKGWQPGTLRRPTEVATAVLGDDAPVAALVGPGLAVEIAAGAPTAMLVAATHPAARRRAAAALAAPFTVVFTASDVAGAETAAAFKNVVAIAVGLAEGVARRFAPDAPARTFTNVAGAVFSRGVLDMAALVRAEGGRVATVLGLAGTADLYATCQQGRNARFGRLVGEGATVDSALATIGSTVEGVGTTASAAELAARAGLDLPTVRMVEQALRMELADGSAPERMRALFATAFAVDPGLRPVVAPG